MSNTAEKHLQEALAAFDFGGEVLDASRYGCGHINDTFCVTTKPGKRYILQRISSAAFAHPEQVMSNIVGVTDYLREKIAKDGGDPERETLSIVRVKNGEASFVDGEGETWRVFPFIEDTDCLQQADTPELFEASALAFGSFQRMLADYPASTLYETIPHFHDTVDRFAKFKAALEKDVMDRAKEVGPEVEFVLAHEQDCAVCMDALRAGKLPLKVTHNDTKLNNVLIDKATGKGICVIDLDTVMPGLSINDFGDSIRFGANHSAEDEKDLSKVNFDLPLFEVYTRGFLKGCGGVLTPEEIEYLPWGAKLMTLECGIRFLTDYLDGDHYFAIHRPEHNLDRCRTQFKLVSDMEKVWEEMLAIVHKYA